jgi:hypothetical protein
MKKYFCDKCKKELKFGELYRESTRFKFQQKPFFKIINFGENFRLSYRLCNKCTIETFSWLDKKNYR